MKKIFFVVRQELYTTFRRASFVIMSFGVPVLAVIILFGVKFFKDRSPESNEPAVEEYQLEVEGFLDLSGLIKTIPEDLPENHIISFENELQLKKALETGEITAYYIIPENYISTGEISYIYPGTKSFLADGQEWVMKRILIHNLLDGDTELTSIVWNPVWRLDREIMTSQAQASTQSGEDCSRPGIACNSNLLIRYMPAIMVVLFYIAFMTSSNMIFNSVAIEKENRTIEVIMMSISPQQLLTGKTLALGFAGLLQMVVWLGAAIIAINAGGTTLQLPDNFVFPTSIAVWGIVFFLGGFGVYASLMAGAGVLVPKIKEAGAANFIALIPLFIGYLVGLLSPLADASNNTLPIVLSFFPLTSPVVMVMRLTDSTVPVYHLLISAGLLFLTAYLALRSAAAMFHAKNLLSGQPFSVKSYVKGFIGI